MPNNGYIVGLTGGIGSGKSTVASLFSALGVAIVDADAISHALTGCGGRAVAVVHARMGPQFIGEDGALNRAVMRERAFSDASAKHELEAILHPLIREEVDSALQTDKVKTSPYAMLAVPLLFDSLTYRDRVDATLLVDCQIATQLERVGHRSGLSPDVTTRIIDAQLPRALRLQLADDIIWNGGMADQLLSQVQPLHERYLRNARRDQ